MVWAKGMGVGGKAVGVGGGKGWGEGEGAGRCVARRWADRGRGREVIGGWAGEGASAVSGRAEEEGAERGRGGGGGANWAICKDYSRDNVYHGAVLAS